MDVNELCLIIVLRICRISPFTPMFFTRFSTDCNSKHVFNIFDAHDVTSGWLSASTLL